MNNQVENQEIRDALLEAVQRAKQQEIDPSKLTDSTKLKDDLELDSLAMIETIWEVEEKFHIHIDEAKLKTLSTVGEVVNLVTSLVNDKAQQAAG